MGKLYDGDRLKAKLQEKKLSVGEITSRAKMCKSTYHLITRTGLWTMKPSVYRVLKAFDISEDEIGPIAGFRTIDSAEFLMYFIETISAVRIDVDTLDREMLDSDEKALKDRAIRGVISKRLRKLGDQLNQFVLDRANYDDEEWSDKINGFWRQCLSHHVLISYISHGYEFVPPDDDSELFATGLRTFREPVIRVMGQLFLFSTKLRSSIRPPGPLLSPEEWRNILFSGKFQTYVPLDPDRNKPHVEWDKGELLL